MFKNLFTFDRKNKEAKKEDTIEKFRALPNRKISEIEKQVIFILIEKSKIRREHSIAVLNKGFLIFFAFVVIAAFSKINELISQTVINALFIFGIMVLVVSALFYHVAVSEEEKNLDNFLDSFLK